MKARSLLALTLTLAAATACSEADTDAGATLLPAGLELREGDVVLRRGEGLVSRLVLLADRHGRFSHAGIVVDSGGVPMIIHAVPGEPDFPGDVDRVKLETPARFFAAGRATRGEVMRPHSAAAGRRAARVAWHAYRRGARFDHHYDDRDTLDLYCTELVLHAYRRAGWPLLADSVAPRRLLPDAYHCFLPLDLERSPRLRTVQTF